MATQGHGLPLFFEPAFTLTPAKTGPVAPFPLVPTLADEGTEDSFVRRSLVRPDGDTQETFGSQHADATAAGNMAVAVRPAEIGRHGHTSEPTSQDKRMGIMKRVARRVVAASGRIWKTVKSTTSKIVKGIRVLFETIGAKLKGSRKSSHSVHGSALVPAVKMQSLSMH